MGLVIGLVGGMAGLGMWLLAMGVAGEQLFPTPEKAGRGLDMQSGAVKRLALALGAGLVVGVTTGWIAMGIVVAGGVGLFWGRLGSQREVARTVAEAEAVAAWTEQVTGSIRAGLHVNAAIRAAADHAGPEIAGPARALARRIETMSLSDAVASFADDLASPTADGVCAAIALSERHGSSRLSDMLHIQMEQTRSHVRLLLEVSATRSQVRTSVRGIMGLTVFMAIGLRFFAQEFLVFYNGVFGQTVMLLIGGLFLMALWLLASLMRMESRPRYFRRLGEL